MKKIVIANWINYILFVLLILIGFLFYQNYAFLLVLAVLIILPVISILFFRKMSEKIKFEISDVPFNAGRNTVIKFKIQTTNNTFYPMGGIRLKLYVKNLFYENKKEYIINIADIPRKTAITEWKFSSLYSGAVSIYIESAQIFDLLRLVTKTIKINNEKYIEIYPEEEKIDMNISALSQGSGDETEVQYQKGTDVSEISGIREYEPGDGMQSVHWKMTARYDEWMVKDYSMPYTNKLYLVLELYRNEEIPDEMDMVIEACFAYAKYMIAGGRQFFLLWYHAKTMSNAIREIRTEDDLMSAVKDILYTTPSDIRTRAYEAYKYEYGESKDTCFYITNTSSEGSVSAEKIAAYKGKAVLLKI